MAKIIDYSADWRDAEIARLKIQIERLKIERDDHKAIVINSLRFRDPE